MGDAAGIGPEIVLKSLQDKSIVKICRPVVIGDGGVLRQTARNLGFDYEYTTVKKGAAISPAATYPIIYDLENIKDEIRGGQESAVTGKASAEYIEEAVKLWREKK